MSLKPPHEVQPLETLPHGVLTVLREQDCASVLVDEPHAPLEQVYEVTSRDWLPVSSQVSLNPPQLLQPP
jgi:hypothetical protein